MPVWHETIKLHNIFHSEELSLTEKRDRIVERIKESRWRDLSGHQILLDELIEELSEALNKEEFNIIWDQFYDLADLDRVWIETV